MGEVLLWNQNKMEREIVKDILSDGLDGAKILIPTEEEATMRILRDQEIDLMIADIPRFDLHHCDMMAKARKISPDTPILVTSTGIRAEIAHHVWRLGLQDYLLKPCRPEWLLAAARALRRDVSLVANDWEERRRERYLKLLLGQLRIFSYKKCTDIAKDYLDELYKNVCNMGIIRFQTIHFAQDLVQFVDTLGPSVQMKLASVMEQSRASFAQTVEKYDAYLMIQKILDLIFTAFDQDDSYRVSGEQRVLNYIDRNINDNISLEQAAEFANMSTYYFSRVFKKMTGKNYITYITDSKISIAQEMLIDTDMPVVKIACDLSYNGANYFSKVFKRKVGMTPTEYRERYSNP